MTKFVAIIPARYASTRFPGKPMAEINGKTMIQRVYERVSDVLEHAYVATDDERIQSHVLSFGGRVVMTSTEHRSGTDRSAEALQTIENKENISFDVVVNIQGDEPFVAREQLEKIMSLFDLDTTQIATLVKRFSANEDIFNPNTPKVVLGANNQALYFSRSVVPYIRGGKENEWQQNHVFFKHIGLYAYRADVLRAITLLPEGKLEKAESLEQLRWLENGYQITVAETVTETIAIDTPEDLQMVLNIFKS